jgi:hypothetical protein
VIGPASSRNVISRNDIVWNRLGGVTVAPYQATAPRENRISANHFDENGSRPIILDLASETNALALGDLNCTGTTNTPNAPNAGITAPRITDVEVSEDGGLRALVRGRACPGQVVEVYQSFATSSIREKSSEMPHVRDDSGQPETISNRERILGLPSIGEFNYLGTTTTTADGTFSATFPLPMSTKDMRESDSLEETKIWASEVLTMASPEDRAFSAIAIDTAGNTSEMSARRKTD